MQGLGNVTEHGFDETPFWVAVLRCLTEFHGLDERQAEKTLEAYRTRLKKHDKRTREFVFHYEPFYLACDLAGNNLEIDDNADKYEKILESVGA
jgi:hypothetical protein